MNPFAWVWRTMTYRRPTPLIRNAAVIELYTEPDPAQVLASMPNDHERALWCEHKAEQARAKWFQGRKECEEDMILSNDIRYRGYSFETRKQIGRRKWTVSLKQRELADADQMYTRWATHYRDKAHRDHSAQVSGCNHDARADVPSADVRYPIR